MSLRGFSGRLFFCLGRGGLLGGCGFGLLLEVLIGGFAVDGVPVFGVKGALLNQAVPGILGGGAHVALRRKDKAALNHGGTALLIQTGDQGFAGAQVGDGLLGFKSRVGPEGFGRGFDGFLLGRGVGPECVLDAVAKL